MLFSMMIVLAFTSTALELMIAARVPFWRRLSAKSPLFNLLNSLFLSFVVGVAFGAAGLVAMGAGVISTVLSVPGYKFLYWNYDSPQAIALGGNRMVHVKKDIKAQYDKWHIALADFAKLIYTFIKILTFPIWALRWILTKSRPYVKRFNDYVDSRKTVTS